jgi:NTP pyrophosphatase (non-canonical NTP hydrolase)
MIMELKDLAQAMHAFVQAKGWYDPGSPRPQTARNIAISVSLEAGEILEHFQWSDEVGDTPALAGELADVALYLLQLASLTGIDLEKAIQAKLEQNYSRNWE